jgi:hypothetical protein
MKFCAGSQESQLNDDDGDIIVDDNAESDVALLMPKAQIKQTSKLHLDYTPGLPRKVRDTTSIASTSSNGSSRFLKSDTDMLRFEVDKSIFVLNINVIVIVLFSVLNFKRQYWNSRF